MVEGKNATNPLGYHFKLVKEKDLALYASSRRRGHAFVVKLSELHIMPLRSQPSELSFSPPSSGFDGIYKRVIRNKVASEFE